MRAHKLPELEKNFKQNLKDSSGFVWKQAKGEYSDLLPADRYVNLTGKLNHYYQDTVAKKLIVIHCTCGVVTGDIAALSDGKKVSTQFVVARDGTAYQLFPTAKWAYHMGLNSSGGNTTVSKTSVAIELSNIGPLKLVGDTLVDIYGQAYCSKSDTDLYVQKSYKGYSYYATYTDIQQDTLQKLVSAISVKTGIKPTLPSEPLKYSAVLPGSTIVFHQNTRTEKVDPGPALNYSKILP